MNKDGTAIQRQISCHETGMKIVDARMVGPMKDLGLVDGFAFLSTIIFPTKDPAMIVLRYSDGNLSAWAR